MEDEAEENEKNSRTETTYLVTTVVTDFPGKQKSKIEKFPGLKNMLDELLNESPITYPFYVCLRTKNWAKALNIISQNH